MTTGKEYILFLDETDTHSNNVYFCLAGFIISRKEYEGILIPEINRVKTDILKSPHIIFHYKDMRQQSNGFEFLNGKTVRDKLWTELCSILKNSNIVTLAAYINAVEFRKDYSKIARSEYNVLFNEIINSFVHFLVKNNSVGTVMLESRGVKQNKSTQELYSQMSKCGTNIYC